ncbi:MAG: hypothetical protein WC313_04075 [Candidatus Kapaibacterium sp.]
MTSKNNKPESVGKKPGDREKKYQKRLKEEQKRLEKIVSSPAKALFGISLIIGLLSFIFTYFSGSSELISGLLTAFFAFSICFIGIGVTMILYFFFKSEQIKKEQRKAIENQNNIRYLSEQEKYKRELSELSSIEKNNRDKKENFRDDKQNSGVKQQSKKKLSEEEAYLEEVLNSGINQA